MDKNLWERERRSIFKRLLREYENEGYSRTEANYFAKIELRDIMIDKVSFVNELWEQEYEEK
jgi:hypothetical protein